LQNWPPPGDDPTVHRMAERLQRLLAATMRGILTPFSQYWIQPPPPDAQG
jgi:hypothetical protein